MTETVMPRPAGRKSQSDRATRGLRQQKIPENRIIASQEVALEVTGTSVFTLIWYRYLGSQVAVSVVERDVGTRGHNHCVYPRWGDRLRQIGLDGPIGGDHGQRVVDRPRVDDPCRVPRDLGSVEPSSSASTPMVIEPPDFGLLAPPPNCPGRQQRAAGHPAAAAPAPSRRKSLRRSPYPQLSPSSLPTAHPAPCGGRVLHHIDEADQGEAPGERRSTPNQLSPKLVVACAGILRTTPPAPEGPMSFRPSLTEALHSGVLLVEPILRCAASACRSWGQEVRRDRPVPC